MYGCAVPQRDFYQIFLGLVVFSSLTVRRRGVQDAYDFRLSRHGRQLKVGARHSPTKISQVLGSVEDRWHERGRRPVVVLPDGIAGVLALYLDRPIFQE